MVKTIRKMGDSNGIVFDAALMELAHLKAGNEVNVEVHQRNPYPDATAPGPISSRSLQSR